MSIYTARFTAAAPSNSAKTMIQVLAGAKPIVVKEFGASFDGIDASKLPVKIELVRQTTAGTGGATLNMSRNNMLLEAPVASAISGCTAEPTTDPTASVDAIIRTWYLTPAGGTFVMQWPLGDEPFVAATARLGVRVTTAEAYTPNVALYLTIDE